MHCKACDAIIKHIVWNEELGDWELCPECLAVVHSTFEDPAKDDDDGLYDEEIDPEWFAEEDYLQPSDDFA